MSDINKINTGNSFDVRINQPSPERRQQRETTVNDESSQGQKTPPKPLPKKPLPEKKTRESSATDDMMEALREQHIQEDIGDYIDRRKEFYRESNRQASEAYIRNQKEVRKEHGKEAVKDGGEAKDAHATYHNRIQDISRAHIQKLMKQKLEGSTFEDVKKVQDPDDPHADDTAKKPQLAAGRLDNSRLRPEVARIIERRQEEEASRESERGLGDPQAGAETHEEEPNQGRSLLENAIGKLKNRLGGAHKGLAASQTSEFRPGLSSEEAYHRGSSETPAPIRANLNEVQASIQRARALRAAADGSQYLPLEDSDVHKLLIEQKQPVEYGTVQAIKQASRQLKDSSYYFQTAVAVLVHAGLSIDADSIDIIRDSLKQYEKYQRESIMNKLYRFLITKKNMQVYQQLLAQESYRSAGAQPELGEALFQGGGPGTMASRAQAQVRMPGLAAASGMPGQTSSGRVDENMLKAGIQTLLKELGLPASKVMVNQLAQSAQGSPLRAQALVFQLAAGRSLHPDEVNVLQQGLEGMSPEDLQGSPRDLMEKLGLPVKQLKASGETLISSLMRQLGVSARQLDAAPLSREAVLLLHELGERTDTITELLPRLAEQIRKQPEQWLKRLAEHQPRLQQFLDAQPHPLAPDKKHMFVNTLMLALELPSVRPRAMNRVAEQLARQNLIIIEPVEVTAETAAATTGESADPTQQASQTPAETGAEPGPSPLPATPDGEAAQPLPRPAGSQPSQASSSQAPTSQAPTSQVPTSQVPTGQAPASPTITGQTASQSLPGAAAAASANPLSASAGTEAVQSDEPAVPGAPRATSPTQAVAQSAQASQAAPAALAPELSELLNLPVWTPERAKSFPMAREAIMLLYLQGERTEQLGQMLPRLTQLLQQAPDAAMRQLERLTPALQDWSRNPSPKAETLNYLLHQLEQSAGPQAASTSSPAAKVIPQAPFALPEHPLEAVMQRHYPALSPKGRELATQQLQGASPALMDGFYQLHRLLGMLEPGKGQALTQLWENPQIYARLARLGPALAPVLEAVGMSPERRYLTPPTQQNQLVQAIQTWLLQGRPEALQSALQQWLEPLTNTRSALGKIKEQLAGFGLQNLPETQLEEIWAQSGGNADAVDAMGMLLKGGFPLVSRNVQTVMQYIEHLPPAWRRQGVSDILLHLSPQLLKLIDKQLEGGSELGRLSTLLGDDLPLLPENWERVGPKASLPDFAARLQLGELRQQLSVLRTAAGLSPAAVQDLENFEGLIQKLQTQLRTVSQTSPGPAELKSLAELCRQLLELRPQSLKADPGSLALQSPAQSWMQLLQPQGSKGQPVLLQQVQDQLSGLFYQLKTILPKLEVRSELPVKTVPANPGALAEGLHLPADPSLQMIQEHMQRWGLQVQSPEMLQQIQTLMHGSNDRLDAMAVLLKGAMPLMPAHIEIVSKYVRNLPPSERFTSISKILSFLSDELLVRMKQDLSARSETRQQQLFPDLDPEEAETARQLLEDSGPAPGEAKLQASRLLPNLPLPQSPGSLQAVTHLLTGKHQPAQWLGPMQQLLGQMQSLLQGTEAPPAQAEVIAQIQSLLDEALPMLQPKTSQLGSWMMGVGSQLADVSSRISEQVNRLGRSSDSESWVLVLLQSLLGLSGWLEEQEPHKRDQIRRYRAQLREQMPALRQSFESLSLLHGLESQTLQASQTSESQPASQYLPAMLQNLGYPVEILVRSDSEDGHNKGKRDTEVQLTIQTHTLGQIYLSMQFSGQNLRIRVGLEGREQQRWIQPYLEALQQKLGDLPWSVASVQTYVLNHEQAGAPVLAHHLRKRYGRSAIEKL